MRNPSTMTVKSALSPVTRGRLVHDLHRLGVQRGQILLVHGSLRSLGWVVGGAPTVVSALLTAVGPDGHVVMPTGTEANSRTSRVHQASIATLTGDQVQAFLDAMPAFDKGTTPSSMGSISEALRTTDGAVRSDHPQSSFAAIGPQADLLMADHPLECHLGPDSPLGKLYKMDAHVLMMAVGYWAFTGFHLAEYLYTSSPPTREYACVVAAANGGGRWQRYDDVVLDDRRFDDIGESLGGRVSVKEGYVGNAMSFLIPLSQAVDHAIEWMTRHRA